VYWENVTWDQNADAIPPWWDWTSALSHAIGVPEAYAQSAVNGPPNPLFNGPTPDMPDDPARRTRRFPGPAADLPAPSVITSLLALNDYNDLSAQVQDVPGIQPLSVRRSSPKGGAP
jgi:hypothetical protein